MNLPVLREAAEDEFPEIVALTNRAYRHQGEGASWNAEDMIRGERTSVLQLRDDLAADPGGALLVWVEKGERLGHVRMSPAGPGVWYLGLLTVRTDRQDQGLGRRLLAAAEGWARARGAGRIRMTVVNVRETLIAWYQRRGYALTGETQPWPYDRPEIGIPTRPDLAFLVMEKAL